MTVLRRHAIVATCLGPWCVAGDADGECVNVHAGDQ